MVSSPGSRADSRSHGAALQRLVGALSEAATPAAIGRLAVSEAAELLGADAAGAYTREDHATLVALHAKGWPAATVARYQRLAVTSGRPLSDAVLERAPVWLEDAEQWRARYPEMAPIGTLGGMQATACLPLIIAERDLGALVFSFGAPRAFPADERDYLLAVAALCAQALDRARLLDIEHAARTTAEQQLRRMTLLADAGRLMETPLSVERRLQQLAEMAVHDFADWCAVHLLRGDEVEQVVVAHQDPDKVEFVARLQQRYPPDPAAPGGAIEVTQTGVPTFMPDIPDELLVDAAVDAEHLALIRSLGMRSAIVAPLIVREHNLGAVTMVQAESGRRFDELDLAFARQLAATAAVALDNARLFEQQLTIAQTLQAALLPRDLPDVPGLRIAARYGTPAQEGLQFRVGGDLYDVVPLRPGPGAAVVVADVCGKGAEAASLTALIRHTLRAEVDHDLDPVEVLHRLNRAMLRDASAGPARFATVAHAHILVDADGASVRLVSAGHPPPLVCRRGSVAVGPAGGTLLGVFPAIDLEEISIRLERGDMMVLYTDGVTEARGVDGFYGIDRLRAVAAHAAAAGTADTVAAAVLDDVVGFQAGRLHDDMAVLVVEATA
jgi:serine phosphatase RsbU (regulator of sigma subunit)